MDWCLSHQRHVLAVAVSTFVITVGMYIWIPKGFFPEEDLSQILLTTEAAEDISFGAMLKLQDQAADMVRNDPNVLSMVSFVGGGGASGNLPNNGRMFLNLKPKSERAPMQKVLEGLRAKFRTLPGLNVFMRPIQNLQLGGKVSKSRYQFILQSVGFEGVNQWSEKMVAKMRSDTDFRDVTTDSQLKGLNVLVDIDREKAASAGVSIADIRTALYTSYGEKQISTIYTPVNTYQVIMESIEDSRQFESGLNDVYVRGRATDRLVPLSSVATFKRFIGPTAVNHQGQIPAVTISFNLAPDVPLGDATEKISKFVKEIELPATIITSYGGDAAVFQSGQSSQIILLVSALFVIYILLGVLYESYIHTSVNDSGGSSFSGDWCFVVLAYFRYGTNHHCNYWYLVAHRYR